MINRLIDRFLLRALGIESTPQPLEKAKPVRPARTTPGIFVDLQGTLFGEDQSGYWVDHELIAWLNQQHAAHVSVTPITRTSGIGMDRHIDELIRIGLDPAIANKLTPKHDLQGQCLEVLIDDSSKADGYTSKSYYHPKHHELRHWIAQSKASPSQPQAAGPAAASAEPT